MASLIRVLAMIAPQDHGIEIPIHPTQDHRADPMASLIRVLAVIDQLDRGIEIPIRPTQDRRADPMASLTRVPVMIDQVVHTTEISTRRIPQGLRDRTEIHRVKGSPLLNPPIERRDELTCNQNQHRQSKLKS